MLIDNYQKIIVFDFETTGLSYVNDRIIEIGAILLEKEGGNFKMSKEVNVLIRQNEKLPDKIIEITGITDELLMMKGISEEEAFHEFLSIYDKDALLIAYNIQFDYGFLTEFFRRQTGLYNHIISNDLLDVMAIYKDRHKFPHRLESAVETYGVSVANTHRALDDVKATFLVLMEMSKERNTITKYINMIGFNPKYGVSGLRAPHVIYVPQYGNRLEIERQ